MAMQGKMGHMRCRTCNTRRTVRASARFRQSDTCGTITVGSSDGDNGDNGGGGGGGDANFAGLIFPLLVVAGVVFFASRA